MNWRILIAVGMAVAMLVPAGAMASHMGQYRSNPIEHDDQGRSDEPDGHSTSIGGVMVTNRVIDRNPNDGGIYHQADATTPPKETGAASADVLAPGCTVEFDRVQSGLCGVHTVGVGFGLVGNVVPAGTIPEVPGVSEADNCDNTGGASVGRYSNAGIGPRDAGAPAFLDHQVQLGVVAGPANWFDVNRKLADLDATLGGALSSALGGSVGNALIGPTAEWAWFGLWGDLNCNGVIDHLQDRAAATPTAAANNEFIWLGGCIDFNNVFRPDVIAGGLCETTPNIHAGGTKTDPQTTMHAWIFPGNHHGFLIPDLPGTQPLCLVDQLISPLYAPVSQLALGANAVFCTPGTDPDQNAADFGGDPLLDDPMDEKWDLVADDRSGDPDDTGRQWILGNGFPVYYYDQSLILSTVTTTGVNCRPNANVRADFDVDACSFQDVDVYPTVSPLVESLVQGVKSAARGVWEPVLDAWAPINRLAQSVDKTVYDATGGAQQGLVDDLVVDPGWSREPNAAGDMYPGVTFGSGCDLNADIADGDEQQNGWCNSGYDTYQDVEHRGWADIQAVRNLLYLLSIYGLPPPEQCVQCINGPLGGFPIAPEPPGDETVPDADDHRRTLGPGSYYFLGAVGRWNDREHTVDESVFPADPGTTFVTYPRDGWIGRVTEGFERYRGYTTENCTTDQGPGPHEWAECHPYEDGNVQDPQDYGLDHGEWQAVPNCGIANNAVITLTPSPAWGNALVWRNPEDGVGPLGPLPVLETIPFGSTAPVDIRVHCRVQTSGTVLSTDWLVLPQGNDGFDVTTSFAVSVPRASGSGSDLVVDVDEYAAIINVV